MLFDVAGNSVPVGDSENVVCTYQTAIQYATGLSITPTTNQEITEGDTLTLSGTLSPNDINNKKITWSTDNKTVASFGGNASATTVTGANLTLSSHKPGTVTIKATPEDGSSSYAKQISVKVKSRLTKIELNKSIVTLDLNGTSTITATTTPSDVEASLIRWSNSDQTVASITTNGKQVTVTGLKKGTTTITATPLDTTGGTIAQSCQITVFPTTLYSYTGKTQAEMLSPGTYKLEVWGAQGGDCPAISSLGGRGGYSYGTISLSENIELFIYVGRSWRK